ncbi:MAG: lysophospholipid acyltransferase family protein [Gammaproteobacteria bacterium]|jgi:1-acyl-sn-glycerol-3-phosphate acyltransferase|uniref:lysophospholipid acyltransferase family protein n=1 Tax=Nevskia sp. TaxID=1929292 RepID=UPI00403613EF|nr:lysophospholipid acyltransferase family protein [Gammaproteobacteria bacterium]
MARFGSLELKQRLVTSLVTPEIEALVASIPKPLGSFGYDPWGYNEDTFKVGLGAARLLYDKYFRVTAHGLENIPAEGRVLIVGNHSGQLPMDGVLVGVAAATNPHGPRLARAMIERFFPTVPWLGNFLNALGGVIGDPVNCARMLEMDEAIIVFPEGVRGSGKLYRKRYQLQRFGNGFMHLAMTHRAPIVPVGIVGCEETMPALANLAPVARLLGLPYLPIVPSLLPLPARVYLNFGKPMVFDPAASEHEVSEQVEAVKAELRRLIQVGLDERTSVY